jgi:hypothetical protein
MHAHETLGEVLLDDGQFLVVLDVNQSADMANGYLKRRCFVGPSTPEGTACVGNFVQEPSGRWCATINAPYDLRSDSDCTVVATGAARLDAIIDLWHARHDAYFDHHSL